MLLLTVPLFGLKMRAGEGAGEGGGDGRCVGVERDDMGWGMGGWVLLLSRQSRCCCSCSARPGVFSFFQTQSVHHRRTLLALEAGLRGFITVLHTVPRRDLGSSE